MTLMTSPLWNTYAWTSPTKRRMRLEVMCFNSTPLPSHAESPGRGPEWPGYSNEVSGHGRLASLPAGQQGGLSPLHTCIPSACQGSAGRIYPLRLRSSGFPRPAWSASTGGARHPEIDLLTGALDHELFPDQSGSCSESSSQRRRALSLGRLQTPCLPFSKLINVSKIFFSYLRPFAFRSLQLRFRPGHQFEPRHSVSFSI